MLVSFSVFMPLDTNKAFCLIVCVTE